MAAILAGIPAAAHAESAAPQAASPPAGGFDSQVAAANCAEVPAFMAS